MPITVERSRKALERALERGLKPTYDINKSYEWNYRNGPLFKGPYPHERKIQRYFRLLDFKLNSPLGVAAGPLLNSNWIKVYARLGFDILSYKTVRTQKRLSNQAPNCVFVDTKGPLTDDRLGEILYARVNVPDRIDQISITNSFGVPSRNPSIWQADVERSKGYLSKGQILVVSVMGSSEYYPEREAFIKDFAICAGLAKEAGADVVELDLSCPNSTAEEGMVYLDVKLSGDIIRKVRARIGVTPLFIKVGNFNPNRWDKLRDLLKTTATHISGIAGINTVKMTVMKDNGKPAVPGRAQSGVCGAAIKESASQFIRWVSEERRREGYEFVIVGVGGVMTPPDIHQFLAIGIDAVEVATAAMWDPYLAYRYYLQHS
jgi:dihydroorotate dehydrogenase (NAD+) catalytic subunit